MANGYVSVLLPEFAGKVVPAKGNVAAIDQSPAFSPKPFGHTPTDRMPLIIGGGDLAHPHPLPGVAGDSGDDVSLIRNGMEASRDCVPKGHCPGRPTGTDDFFFDARQESVG
ncbi:FAD dependent oxidoreductase [Fusarium beomiforme]|uniref:FAD dependent oxidoreductase n=1 Tax=Fusarium beomiforme TaxID=44412 RepID=A0A9P5AQU4_9HYPO|nr:FAD dependent oxidoreductase [Fusarium beomiforme]